MGRQTKPTSLHHSTPQPPKNLTTSVATLKAELNATKAALATEVALKLGGGATFDGTLPRFVGSVTCYVDDATGDVVGLQLGSDAPLCSTAGQTRTFAVPADGYISDVKVAVDKATELVGGLAFVVKSNASMVPTNIVTCGTHGGVGVSVMPKLSALAGVTAACKPAQSGRRLHQAGGSGLAALDPASLGVTATTVNAPAGSNTPTPTPPTPPPTPPATRYAYVANFANSVSVCPVDPLTGALVSASCATSGSGFNGAYAIAVAGGYAYVTNIYVGTLSVCNVDSSTGALASCTMSNQAFGPFGLEGMTVSSGYAYVVNTTSNSVSVCP